MMHSIRWRLITSYVLLTLLTVSVVGLLAQWAVQRYAEGQATASLAANAEAVAAQALPLMQPVPQPLELYQLAKAASFFGNAEVRILDIHQNTLVDSGPPGGSDAFALFQLPDPQNGQGLTVILPENWALEMLKDHDSRNGGGREGVTPLDSLPPGTALTIVRRHTGPWGNRFSFSKIIVGEPGSASGGQNGSANNPNQDNGQATQRIAMAPVGEAANPAGYVEIRAEVDSGTEAQAAIRRGFVLAGIGAVALAGIVGLVMGRRLTGPLGSLTETTRKMSAGDLSVRAPVQGNDEIGELAVQFNQMAEQVQASFDQVQAERDSLRRFVADASHELRTPITALRSFNELMQGAARGDAEAQQEFLRESEAQIVRLEWITRNLLDLSRLDAGLINLNISEVEATELAQAALAPFWKPAAEKGIQLRLEGPPGIKLACDPQRAEMALSNLLDNAIKFTPPGGAVTVGVEETADAVRTWVQDSGPGISEADLPHVFERFYRGQTHNQPGSGLGLSIVESILQAHGGRAWAENRPEGGARFTLEWGKKR